MFTPESLDLGSVMDEFTYEGTRFGFKVYPRLVMPSRRSCHGSKRISPTCTSCEDQDPCRSRDHPFPLKWSIPRRSVDSVSSARSVQPQRARQGTNSHPLHCSDQRSGSTVPSGTALLRSRRPLSPKWTAPQRRLGPPTSHGRNHLPHHYCTTPVLRRASSRGRRTCWPHSAGTRQETANQVICSMFLVDRARVTAQCRRGGRIGPDPFRLHFASGQFTAPGSLRRHHSRFIPCRLQPTNPKKPLRHLQELIQAPLQGLPGSPDQWRGLEMVCPSLCLWPSPPSRRRARG